MPDWVAVIISFAYVFAALLTAERLRLTRQLGPNFTRKFIHIAVGMWSVGTIALFENRWMAIIPPAAFVTLNYLSHRLGLFKAMETPDESNLGTVYFPIAFAAMIMLFWERPAFLVASLMPLTWGDAMAAILGKQYGQIRYAILGHVRSVEGSVSMFLFSLLSTLFALWLLPPNSAFLSSLGLALAVALGATVIEGISPWGLDNLTVPAVSAVILLLMTLI